MNYGRFLCGVVIGGLICGMAEGVNVQMTVNSSVDVKPISPYIYGSNSPVITHRTLDRLGGNRWTGYNWETNASNAGSDWYHYSDYYLVNFQTNTPPGEAVRPTLQAAATAGRATVVTVPIAGYAAADANGPVSEAETAPSARWKQVVAKKSTIYPGSPLSLNPNKTDNYVFTDEFVNWVENKRQGGQMVFYSLDNEPGLWNQTHPRIHPAAPTFAEVRDKTIAHASAIKDVNPNALVFGGVGYGWMDFLQLQDAPDKVTTPSHPGGDWPSGELHFYEWLLQQVAQAEAAQGRTLMDVLDLHWYPEATGGGVRITGSETTSAVVAARVQAPRSLWDPTYVETSWISQWMTWQGSPGNPGPVKLLPRIQRDINDFKPGTKIAITEYNYGAGNHISGGIAQADVLGIFGRMGVFAAAWWDLGNGSSYVNAAFNMYLNFDGQGKKFGDTSVYSATSDLNLTSIHASTDSEDPNRMVLVVINRSGSAVTVDINITHPRALMVAGIYQLTGASADIVHAGDIALTMPNRLSYTLPAYSVTTVELTTRPGDLNGDAAVDDFDLNLLLSNWGQNVGPAMGNINRQGVVDEADLAILLANWGGQRWPGYPAPEPGSGVAVLTAVLAGLLIGRRR